MMTTSLHILPCIGPIMKKSPHKDRRLEAQFVYFENLHTKKFGGWHEHSIVPEYPAKTNGKTATLTIFDEKGQKSVVVKVNGWLRKPVVYYEKGHHELASNVSHKLKDYCWYFRRPKVENISKLETNLNKQSKFDRLADNLKHALRNVPVGGLDY